MSSLISRGALIVLEGGDKCGKSTQCRQLVANLTAKGVKSELWRYPERSTAIGKVINDYLEKKIELEDHAVHLLFSANRWESVPRMKALLSSGVTLVVDRYAFSGVAFTGAKDGFDLGWCRTPDVGLPEPDCVVYLTLNPVDAAKRGDYGGERYEDTDFQTKVERNFRELRETSWRVLDAARSIPEIESELLNLALEVVEKSGTAPLGSLWTNTDDASKSNGVVNGAAPNKTILEKGKENVEVNGQPGIKKLKADNNPLTQ